MAPPHESAAKPPSEPGANPAARSARRTVLAVALLIGAAVALHAGSLSWGFAYDDFLHQYVLRGLAPGASPRSWDLYNFTPWPAGGDPASVWRTATWWAADDFKARFFRPVASLSIWLDFEIYGDWSAGYHITSLLLFAGFLGLVFRLYRDLGLTTRGALWGLVFVAFDDVHTLPVQWIANRNALLASMFCIATLLALGHYRRSGRRVFLGVAALCFLLACGSKESGLATFPLTGLYLLLFSVAAPGAAVGTRCVRLVRSPMFWLLFLLAAGHLTFYVGSGYGARSDVYPTPWADFGTYLFRLAALFPLAMSNLLFGVALDLVAVYPRFIWPLICLTIPALAVAGVAYARVARITRVVVFGAGWVLMSLLVEAGGEISDRLLMNVSVGAGLLLGHFFDSLGSWRQRLAARQYLTLGLASVLLCTGIALSIPATLVRSVAFAKMAMQDRRLIFEAQIDRAGSPPREVFLLNSPSGLQALTFAPTWNVQHDDTDTYVFPLQLGGRALIWTREDERTATFTSGDAPFLDHRLERLLRYRGKPSRGDVFRTSAFSATALAVEAAGIRTIRVVFEKPLEDPFYVFLVFQEGRFARTAPPAIGETVELATVPPLVWYAP